MMAPEAKPPCVIVGLGNPGKKYEMTRHNMGFLTVMALAERLGWAFKDESQFMARTCKGVVGDKNVHLVLPQTYMNESGIAVRRYLDYYKMAAANLLVVTDDVALGFGGLRLRWRGSSGGHNGLKSIQAHLGTIHYSRLRMGIGEPGKEMIADFVLGAFLSSEIGELEKFIERGVAVLKRFIEGELHSLMNEVNCKKKVTLKEGQENSNESCETKSI